MNKKILISTLIAGATSSSYDVLQNTAVNYEF